MEMLENGVSPPRETVSFLTDLNPFMALSDRKLRRAANGTESTCAGVVTVIEQCHSCHTGMQPCRDSHSPFCLETNILVFDQTCNHAYAHFGYIHDGVEAGLVVSSFA